MVRSVKGKILKNRVKAPDLVHIFLRLYKKGRRVAHDPGIRGTLERKSILNNMETGQPDSITNYLMAK